MNESEGKTLQDRPEKSKNVEKWWKSHPDGSKADCQIDTGLDPKQSVNCGNESKCI